MDGSGAAPPLPPTAASGTAVAEISVGAPGSEVIKLDLEVIRLLYQRIMRYTIKRYHSVKLGNETSVVDPDTHGSRFGCPGSDPY